MDDRDATGSSPGLPRLHPDPQLESLIRRLNESARERPATLEADDATSPPLAADRSAERWSLDEASEEGRHWLTRLLEQARRSLASDLLIVRGAAPTLRLDGKLRPLSEPKLAEHATRALCAALVPANRRADVQRRGHVDFTTALPGLGRFRCNVHRERGSWAAAVRVLPEDVPSFEELGLPEELARLAHLDHGLVLVTGPTGSGKSTTVASLVRRILAHRPVHMVTIEDPVEYTHPHGDGVIEHVEVGRDVDSFAKALRSALRQDPDVLLIGEMRDPESMAIAITAAETGHLVLSTLHTGDAPQTVNRILDGSPPAMQETLRVQLSVSLAAIVSQQLLPRKNRAGRVPAVEVLIGTPAVRNLVRQGRTAHLRAQLTLEKSAGMIDLDRSLAALVRAGLVEADAARPRARDPESFDEMLRRGGR